MAELFRAGQPFHDPPRLPITEPKKAASEPE
jgi:hypothetical protein